MYHHSQKQTLGVRQLFLLFTGVTLLFFGLFFASQQVNAEEEEPVIQWERYELRSGEVAEIAISPSHPNTVYAAFEADAHTLYKSTNGGESWEFILKPGDHAVDVAVSSQNPETAVVAMTNTVDTTDLSVESNASTDQDGDVTISEKAQVILKSNLAPEAGSSSFTTIEIFEQDDSVIYAGVKGEDTGESAVLYKSTNSGTSWTQLLPNIKALNVVAIHPEDHNVIYIGANDGVYKSTDSGKTLSKLKNANHIISIEMQYDDPDVIYIATKDSVFKTTDAGATWQNITNRLSTIHRVRVSRSNPNVLYAATGNGLFRSSDYGGSWEDKTSNLVGDNIHIVSIDPHDPNIAYVGHSTGWSNIRGNGFYRQGLYAGQGIFKTTDGGDTWQRADNGIAEYTIEVISTNPHNQNEAWVAAKSSRGGYKTQDAGYHWRLSQTPSLHEPMQIEFSMQNPDAVFASSWHTGGVFSSSLDGGITWKETDQATFHSGINRGKGLFDQTKEGDEIHIHGFAVDPTNDSILYAGSVYDKIRADEFPLDGAHIFKSIDAGVTWKEFDDRFPHESHTSIHNIVIDPLESSTLYVATTEHESKYGIGIYKSTDNGLTWRAINTGLDDLSVGAIIIHPERTHELLAATHSGIYKSTNGGERWEQKKNIHSSDIAYVIERPSVVYASTDDGVYRSTDFGESWKPVSTGLASGHGQAIGVGAAGTVLYTAVENEGLFIARLGAVESVELETEKSEIGHGGKEGSIIEKAQRISERYSIPTDQRWIIFGIAILLAFTIFVLVFIIWIMFEHITR